MGVGGSDGLEGIREDGGEKVDRVGRDEGIMVGGVSDVDDEGILSHTSKLTCVR